MHVPIFTDILVIFGLSILVLFVGHRLRIPPIVGFLLTGMIAGPHGFGAVTDITTVETLAEIGVILLLFTIGLEFSLKHLMEIRKSVLLGGSVQVVLTIAFVGGLSLFTSEPKTALFIGFLIALSSTAIVLKIIQERAETSGPHGRTILGILIFQDIIVVPMMIVTPLLAGTDAQDGSRSPYLLIGLAALMVVFVIISARYVVPYILYQVAKTRDREFFLLSIVMICFAVAWLTAEVGLSLALGAFLAGLIISESEYSHQALGNILPFKDVFTSFFFVSIGMLLDAGFLLQEPVFILLITLAVIVIKLVAASIAAVTLRMSLPVAIRTGLGLAQVGEFSFVLSKTGLAYGLLDPFTYQVFLSVSVLSMVATPFLIAFAPKISDYISSILSDKDLKTGIAEGFGREELHDHLVIIGFGITGRNLARVAKVIGIRYVIIELNADTVREELRNNENIMYGDATHDLVLQYVSIEHARVAVVAISDAVATRRIIERITHVAPNVHIIARTRFTKEVQTLYGLGAHEVIPEEFETAVEIFTRVMNKYLIPRKDVETFISEIRADGYNMLRSPKLPSADLSKLKMELPNVEISTVRISPGSFVVGKTLGEISLRQTFGINLLAIRRDDQIITNPTADVRVEENDIWMVLGETEIIASLIAVFENVDGISRP